MPLEPPRVLIARVATILGARPTSWEPVAGGYTAAGRWIVHDAHGRTAFVKVATNANTEAWLHAEWRIYGQVTAPFLPRVLGWDDGQQTGMLLTTDITP